MNITIPVSFSIMILLLFKKICLKRIPAKWHLILWIAILIQMMIPVQIKIPDFFKVSEPAVQIETTTAHITLNLEQVFEPVIVKNTSTTYFFDPQLIWISGVLVLSILFIRSAWLFNQRIRDEAQECQDHRVQTLLSQYPLKAVILPHIHSAALPLTRWDLLILSKEIHQLSDMELELMLTHELVHIQYHHRLISIILHILRIIYWFNPLVHLMHSRIHQEMEMMCDEIVIEQNSEKIELYGNLLIDMQAGFTAFESIALSKKARKTKERLGHLMNKKHKSILAFTAVLLVLGLSILPLLAQEKVTTEQNPVALQPSPQTSEPGIQTPEKLSAEEFIAMMIQPIDSYKITCQWGCYAGHEGIDVINTENRYGNVYAVYSGIVIETGYDSSSGNYIIIDHQNGYQTHYQHLNEIYVTINQEVCQKESIGSIGKTGMATGPHLHLQLTFEGTSINIDSLFEE